jgi:hypothetical protein
MGDVPIAYVEGAGGVRVSEEEIVAVGKHDVRASANLLGLFVAYIDTRHADTFFQSRALAKWLICIFNSRLL